MRDAIAQAAGGLPSLSQRANVFDMSLIALESLCQPLREVMLHIVAPPQAVTFLKPLPRILNFTTVTQCYSNLREAEVISSLTMQPIHISQLACMPCFLALATGACASHPTLHMRRPPCATPRVPLPSCASLPTCGRVPIVYQPRCLVHHLMPRVWFGESWLSELA
jgi:hypothetical protein